MSLLNVVTVAFELVGCAEPAFGRGNVGNMILVSCHVLSFQRRVPLNSFSSMYFALVPISQLYFCV